MRVVLATALALACGCGPPVGTNPGSILVDLVPGPGSSNPTAFRKVGSRVYFATFEPRAGTWRTDGTPEGTEQVSDVPLAVVDAGDRDAWGVDLSGVPGVYWIQEGGLAERIGDGFAPIAARGHRAVASGPAGLTVFDADGTTTVIDTQAVVGWTFTRAGRTIYGCPGFGGGAMRIDLSEPALHGTPGPSPSCSMIGAVGNVALAFVPPSDLQRVSANGVDTLLTGVCCGVYFGDGLAYAMTTQGAFATDGYTVTAVEAGNTVSVLGVHDDQLIASAIGATYAIGPDRRELLASVDAYFGMSTPGGFWFWDANGQRWITDGTAAGTRIGAPVPALTSTDVAMVGDLLFYTGFDGHGQEPWVAEMRAVDVAPLPDAGPVM